MSMQIIFLFVANPASQMPKSVYRLKLSYEHPAKPAGGVLHGEPKAQSTRSEPQKKRATVPGPVWLPMRLPT